MKIYGKTVLIWGLAAIPAGLLWMVSAYVLSALLQIVFLGAESKRPDWMGPLAYRTMFLFFAIYGFVVAGKIKESRIANVFLAASIPLACLATYQVFAGTFEPIAKWFLKDGLWPFCAALGAYFARRQPQQPEEATQDEATQGPSGAKKPFFREIAIFIAYIAALCVLAYVETAWVDIAFAIAILSYPLYLLIAVVRRIARKFRGHAT